MAHDWPRWRTIRTLYPLVGLTLAVFQVTTDALRSVPGSVYECGADPKDSAPIPGDEYNLETLISNDDVSKKIAWCDPDGNSYFLLNAYGTGVEGGNEENLDGKKWGGITLEMITQSAKSGFEANGNKNPFEFDGGPDVLDAWAKLDSPPAQAPGFFNFPFCSSVDMVYRLVVISTTPSG